MGLHLSPSSRVVTQAGYGGSGRLGSPVAGGPVTGIRTDCGLVGLDWPLVDRSFTTVATAPSSRYPAALASNHCPAASDLRKGSCGSLLISYPASTKINRR